jgi:2-keto-4-pentenoate hydratase
MAESVKKMTPVSLLPKTRYNRDVMSTNKKARTPMNPPPQSASQKRPSQALQDIAARFVTARKLAQPLAAFPGVIPGDLKHSYEIQDLAINLWPEPIGGWKVGRIPPALEGGLGIDRLAGPIFTNTIVPAESGAVIEMPMFAGGFAAIEAEFVAVIARDAPADKLAWSMDEALAMVADLRIGLEIASSPLATINELGPTAVAADFGNNLGLVVGPSIANWRGRALDSMQCSSFVNGREVGAGGAFNLTGGFVRSVQFLLELTAKRKRPVRAGDVIATGQTTGIHDVAVGQLGQADFADDGNLSVRLVAAEPTA